MLSVTPVKWASKTTYLMGQQQRPHDMVGERQLNQHLACTDPPHVGTPRKWSVFTLMVRKAEPQRQVVLAPGIVLPTFMPTTECVCPVSAQCRNPSLTHLHGCRDARTGSASTVVHTFSPDLPVARQSQKPVQAHTTSCPLGPFTECVPMSRGCRHGWGAAKYGKTFSPH